ncbi:glycosyltransferase family 2 protein [Microbacterium sp. zg.B48]|uniref:glycosyltransferase family 2 protein n=1 Tax=Microbacterium sp. zg.B48 TaxID=2969408 RepID=UPI00214AD327|nr:glycosyltransferase family 2 protein [Microbacterium sp. zg.B48]MCR2763290.1 glycosyltransferase family 2 protein [Microbacterium sp. zg.B48]
MPDVTHAYDLSTVIVNYNTPADTAESVRSLLATTQARVQVILVDNGSSDGSAETLREQFPEITVIDAGANLGFAAGVNLGARSAQSPWVLLLNPDVVVLPGAIDALLAFATAHPEHGLYGGRTLRPDGTTDPSSCWGAMSLWSLTCFATGLSTLLRRSVLFDPESLGRWERDTVREVPVITGCLLLISLANWERLGGMDERFFLYGEDADFSARARAEGLRPVIVPDAAIIHAVGGSTASSGRKMSMVMAGKATVLRTTWHPAAARVGIALLQAGTALRALPGLLRRREGMWTGVWRSRRDWRAGYPAAKTTLFGFAPDPHDPHPGTHHLHAEGAHR